MIARLSTLTSIAALLVSGCQKHDEVTPQPRQSAGPVVPGPAGGWTEQVVATPEGGFLMGNPKASVKIIEYGSLTCPHCADFAAEAYPALQAKYIATGKVSLELRNYVRDPADIAASLVSRCGGPGPYYKLTEQIFATQKEWIGKLQNIPPDQSKILDTMPQDRQIAWLADRAGFTDFARQRGIPGEKVAACIADKGGQEKLIAMRDKATTDYNLSATPTFLVNGEVIEGATWLSLEPKIKDLLG